MFAVVGVSGNTGSAVATRLLDAGAPVRVVVRDAAKGEAWRARGAEVAVADVGDADALERAFAGVRGAWIVLPPDPTSTAFLALQARRADAIARAASRAKVRHLALLSSVAAQFPGGTGPIVSVGRAETLFASAVPRVSAVRAAYFLDNLGGSLGALADGLFPTFLHPDAVVDMVAPVHAGHVGAQLLLQGGVEGLEIHNVASGPQVSVRDAARVTSEVLGRPLQVVHAPESAIVPTLTSLGMSADVAGLYLEMISGFNAMTSDPWDRTAWFHRGPPALEATMRRLLGR